MSNFNTMRVSELDDASEIDSLSENSLLEVSVPAPVSDTNSLYQSKKISFSRFSNWLNLTLGRLITYFNPRVSLTEAISRLFERTYKLEDLEDVEINRATLEPRGSERFNSALVYDGTKWTNEIFPFIEYQGIIRGNNKTPIAVLDPESGQMVDEHIVIPAGINVWSMSEIIVDISYYSNIATTVNFTDITEAEGDPKPKRLDITFKKSPAEMTGNPDATMGYKLRIWT